MIPNATLKDDSQLLTRLRSSKERMCPERAGIVSAPLKNSAEDPPRRASSGHYSRRPVFLFQFYPSRKKRASTADFSYPITLNKPGKSPSVGRAVLCTPRVWRPQESNARRFSAVRDRSTEYLRLTQPPLQCPISCQPVCRRFPWFSFPGRHGSRTIPSSCDLCRSSVAIRELAFSFRASFPFRW